MSHLNNLYNKITDLSSLKTELQVLRADGKRIVFTNGCFDILHRGHVEYLAQAADKGDVLVLGLNSDDSVRRQEKGEGRPINEFEARATVLAGLSFVDYILEFDDDTPLELIRELVPDVLVKGGDYDPDQGDKNAKDYIVGRDVVLDNGGNVKVIPLVKGFSTTNLINKMKQ